MAVHGAPRVRVIVVNFNAGALLARCLAALERQTLADFEAVVVDNGSTDGSCTGALPSDPRFRLVRLGANLGFAEANNRGAVGCGARWIATLNPDAFPEPTWLAALIAAAERHPEATMFGSTQLDAADPERLDGAGDALFAAGIAWRGGHGRPRRALPPEGEVFSPCAAAALYRTDPFLAAGGFDRAFFCFLEDVDLGFRLRLMGGRCIQVPAAVVHHVGSAIAGKASDFARYHGTRNRLWVFVKNMPPALFWSLLPAHIGLQAALLIWAACRGHAGPVWRGLKDGVRGLPAVWRERQAVQRARRLPWTAVARALTWSPACFARRLPDVRPNSGRLDA